MNYLYENYINIARQYKMDNNKLKALKFYKKAYSLKEGKNDSELQLDMALLYDEVGLKNEAEHMYRNAIASDKEDARGYYGLAVIYDE